MNNKVYDVQNLGCYATKTPNYWIAYCPYLSLYAIGNSLIIAKKSLANEINEYVYEATHGNDKQYNAQLIPRIIIPTIWLSYYLSPVNVRFYLPACIPIVETIPQKIKKIISNYFKLIGS